MTQIKIIPAKAIGLFAFSLTLLVTNIFNFIWQGNKTANPLFYISLTYYVGGVLQVVCGFIQLFSGDVFYSTILTSYGAFWLSSKGLLVTEKSDHGTALFCYFVWFALTVIFAMNALKRSIVLVIALSLMGLALVFLRDRAI
ncbi:hypothetical protein MHBO_002358 [Bonamia ostreae]|uniref:GPR1/FUN34/yaaH family protein n=1 Tax=Bonamia ostreae TaxID=126728 RepID=A0ABV2AM07_9EUKA